MERIDRALHRDADGEEAERGGDRAMGSELGDPRGEVGHVEGAGHLVEESHPDEEERGPDGAEHEVAERRDEGFAAGAEADQHVRRERGDLEEHEDVEGVGGHRHPEKPRKAEQPRGVEEMDPIRLDFPLHAPAREEERERADDAHHEHHPCVRLVHPVLDAPRRRPGAEEIRGRPFREGALEEAPGSRHREKTRRHRHQPRHPAPPEEHAHGRRDERHHDLERGQVGGDHGRSRRSERRISSSSIVS